jgi:hypothetical protein
LQKGQQKILSSFTAGFFRDAIFEFADFRFAIELAGIPRAQSQEELRFAGWQQQDLSKTIEERSMCSFGSTGGTACALIKDLACALAVSRPAVSDSDSASAKPCSTNYY